MSTRGRRGLGTQDHHIVCMLSYVDVFLDNLKYDTYIRMRLKSESYFVGWLVEGSAPYEVKNSKYLRLLFHVAVDSRHLSRADSEGSCELERLWRRTGFYVLLPAATDQ